jgi:hypothetical protein
MAQEATLSPLEEMQKSIAEAQSDLNLLQSGVRLNSIRDEVENIDTLVTSVPLKLQDVRAQGYVFDKTLEPECSALKPQWDLLRPAIFSQISQQSVNLDSDMRAVESLMTQLSARANNLTTAAPFLSQVQSSISTLKSKVSSSESNIRGMYDSFKQDANHLADHLDDLIKVLGMFAAATFKLKATEGAINAVDAVWAINGKQDKDDPKGHVFLTDQRVLFEQNQEIATKKFLFITTESEVVHKLLFEFPVVLIQEAVPSKQGLFKNEDHIDLKLASGAPFPTCHLHLDGQDCADWDKMISRVQTKEYDQDRVVEISSAEIEKVKKAPALCPACGGVINQIVLRGQDTITCTYCGNVIRL